MPQDVVALRNRLAGQASLTVRDRQGRVLDQRTARNTITPLGQWWLFQLLATSIGPGSNGYVPGALAGEASGSGNLPYGSVGATYLNNGMAYYDGTHYHSPYSPWALLALGTGTTAIGAANVVPDGTCVACYTVVAGNKVDQPYQNTSNNGETTQDLDGLTINDVADLYPSPPAFAGPNTVQVAASFAYNTTGTSLTVASMGFVSGLYAQTGTVTPTTWTGIVNSATHSPFLLSGAGANAANLAGLSAASWLVLASPITVPNGSQLAVVYDLQFQPAT